MPAGYQQKGIAYQGRLVAKCERNKSRKIPVPVAVLTFKLIQVDDFHYIWKGICHFLSVINSNLGRISYLFRAMVSFPLKNAHFFYPSMFNPNFENVRTDC